MIDLSQEGYSHDGVLRLLCFPGGRRKESYRLDVLRNGIRVAEAEFTQCAITCDADSQVKHSAWMTLRDNGDIQWDTDFLRPVMMLETGGQVLEFPFIPLKPMTVRYSVRNGVAFREVEAYDETVLLQNNSIGHRLYIPKGSLYTAVIQEILRGVGFASIQIAASDAVFGTDREDWERDESIFDLVNQLLGEINYRSLTVNRSGALVSRKYTAPARDQVGIQYQADKSSVVLHRQETELDAFGRPNVFIGEVNNPDLDAVLEYTYVNDSPNSPTSTICTGRKNTAVKRWDNVQDQETLMGNVLRWAAEETARYKISTLYTAIMPHHEVWEVLSVETEGANGVFCESSWSIGNLSPGGSMNHVLRSVEYG